MLRVRYSLMTGMSGIDCVREQVPLAERTWFKVGGAAQFFAEPTSIDELQALVKRSRDEGLHVRLLGGGAKALARDEGVNGIVISLANPAFANIAPAGERVTVGAGAMLANAITMTVG